MDRRLGENDARFRHPDEGHRMSRCGCGLKNAWLGHSNVFAREDHQPPRDEPRVLPRFQHSCQIVQSRIGITPAHALDECTDDVVMLISITVVTHRRVLYCGFDSLEVDDAIVGYCNTCSIECSQSTPSIPGAHAYEEFDGFVRYGRG